MSKLTQIETALRGMDGARFHQLCDTYLHRRGYEAVNPLGRMIGADKVVKGTPDTWMPQPGGKFLFAEYTTERNQLFEKLRGDLRKCVDEAKTGVPVDRIQEIIFCHTGVLRPDQEDALVREAQAHGVLLSTIGIGPLAHDLYQKYPGIAHDFLNVEIDTGQVLETQEFIATYGRNVMATPLDTGFYFRDEEVEYVLGALEEGSLVLLSGQAGLGKTRLALECFRRFADAHPDFVVRCIFNRGRDLFQDLRVHFAPPGNYLVLVDDANRVSGFDYILQLLHEAGSDRTFKIIATVRDYARAKVREIISRYGAARGIELQPLPGMQVAQLLEREYGIVNREYLGRIDEISKGNPRLAVMAAKIVLEENSILSIADASALYDEYYATIRQDLQALGDRTILRVAGIIAFFRVVDRTNREQMHAIADAFGIGPEVFWEAAERLHEMELLDMYENEVVKAQDQVLSTYLFYLAFFKERGVLDLAVLLERFFPRYRHRLTDALQPVVNAFGGQAQAEQLRPHVERVWRAAETSGNENHLLHLMDAFWYVVPTDTLLAVRDRIAAMPAGERGKLKLNYRNNSGSVPQPSVLSILGRFRNAGELRRAAFDLLLDYAAKCPSDLPHVLSFLVDGHEFRRFTDNEQLEVQRIVVDAFVDRFRAGEDDLFIQMYLVVAEAFLQTTFHAPEWEEGSTVENDDAGFGDLTELEGLRSRIWRQLFAFAGGAYRARVLGVLHAYATSLEVSGPEVVAGDAREVLPFLEREMEPSSFGHCVLTQAFLDLLDRVGISYDHDLRKRFRSETYTLAELLHPEPHRRMGMGWEEFQAWRRERVQEHFASYRLPDYERFFGQCTTILATARDDNAASMIRAGIEEVLLGLAEREPSLYTNVIERYLAAGNPLDLGRFALAERLVSCCGADRAFEILSIPDYRRRRRWLFDFYWILPAPDVTEDRLAQLYSLYRDAEVGDLPYDLSFLRKYAPFDSLVVLRVVEILVDKEDEQPGIGRRLESLFRPDGNLNRVVPSLFGERLDLLKRAYLVLQRHEPHGDYDGAAFNMLLDLSPGFGREYVEWVFERHMTVSPSQLPQAPDPHHDHRDYDFLWRREDHREVMRGIVRRVYELEQGCISWHSYLSVFFAVKDSGRKQDTHETQEAQDRFLAELIADHSTDIRFLEWLFELICGFSPERRYVLLEVFLAHNRSYDDFAHLNLEPDGYMARGSFVPVYNARVQVLESFLPLFRAVDLLRHRQRVERDIRKYRRWIEEEKKSNFMQD